MEDISQYAQLLAILSDGSIVVFLILTVLAFLKGWVLPKATHDEMQRQQQVIVDHMCEKVDNRFTEHEEKFEDFTSEVGGLSQTYYKFLEDFNVFIRESNGSQKKMITILQAIQSELEKMNGS